MIWDVGILTSSIFEPGQKEGNIENDICREIA